MTYECRADEDEDECESQEGDDQSERVGDVQHDGHGVFEFMDEENNNVNVVLSFLALHEAMESEEGRYVSVDGEGCEISNNLNPKDLMEFFPVQHHSAPSLQFENVENIGNVISSDWTPWGNTNIGNSCGEFMVGQVFNSKAYLQHAANLYSISAPRVRCVSSDDATLEWYARAFILALIGSSLFTEKKGTHIHMCFLPLLKELTQTSMYTYIGSCVEQVWMVPSILLDVSHYYKYN